MPASSTLLRMVSALRDHPGERLIVFRSKRLMSEGSLTGRLSRDLDEPFNRRGTVASEVYKDPYSACDGGWG